MISEEDFQFITQYESSSGEERKQLFNSNRVQCAKTLNAMLGHISKDQTIQYILCLVDDMILEDKTRVEIFKEYSKKKKESVWNTFLNLLNRNDNFIQNMVSIIDYLFILSFGHLFDALKTHLRHTFLSFYSLFYPLLVDFHLIFV